MIDPVIYDFGGFKLRWYSVFILCGVMVAYFLINSESRRQRIKNDFVFNVLFWALIFGIIGARLYYVVFNFGAYKNDLSEIWKIWHGGLAIHGGLLFGLITIILYCKKYKAKTLKILDIVAPAILIAQAIGRWGNFFNQEAYGSIVEYSTLANMKIIPQFIIDNMYIQGAYRLPMFYFESLFCLLGFIIIMIFRRRKHTKNGQVLSFYLIWYGILRFFIEIFRSDSLMIADIKVAQVVSVIMVIVGVVIFVIQHKKPVLDELYNKKDDDIRF